MKGRAPRLTLGDELIVEWVDITEDASAEGDIEPYVFETRARFVKWKQSKVYGRVLLLTATFAISKGHENEHYGVLAIPKGCIISLKKRGEVGQETDVGRPVGDGPV